MIENLHAALHQIEHEWSKLRLMVAGDVMLDKYIWGEVARISPEAPVPVVRAMHQTEQPGGAANVAMNLARFGASVVLAGFAGTDDHRNLLEASLRANSIDPVLVESDGFPTITKLRILGGRQQMLRLDYERVGERAAAEYEQLLQAAVERLPQVDALILSDYAKGVLTPQVCRELIGKGRSLGIPVLVDPKSADFSRYRGATTICPNLGELAAAARQDTRDLETLLAAAASIVDTLGLEFMTVTLSERGIALVRPDRHAIAPAQARQVFDVSGAGDTVIAVLALSLASGLTPETAVQLANAAAGIVVGKVGTVPVEKHELLAALAPDIALSGADKMVSRDELGMRVATWRASGERVVFTNGCFDLLHLGHISFLEEARRAGDRLIVGINSDASVCALKGPGRPIVGERDRARVIAALSAVDAVVVFAEPTPMDLIVMVRPDVIVKGSTYNIDTVVGAREVQSWGGQVKIVPTLDGFSTQRLIEARNSR